MSNDLLEEARNLTKEYATKNKCYATFDIKHEFHGYKDDDFIIEVFEYSFFTINNVDVKIIDCKSIEELIQKLKTLVTKKQS